MPSARPALPDIQAITTPLCGEAWARELGEHPDKAYAAFIIRGIQNGFRIGFDYSSNSCTGVGRNMISARFHPQQIQEYIEREVAAGRVIGPLLDTAAVQISRFGVIPKPHQPGKWRLITDLSSPEGASVNDGIDRQLCSVTYPSVDDAVATVLRLGKGTLLAKFDLESAYRMVPVHPIDRPLLGMKWKGATYVDGALPFGLRSAPKLFTAVADALLWIMRRHGVRNAMHYLDDFLLLAPPREDECRVALATSLRLCHSLGERVAPHKTEGPSTIMSFLGIRIDTARFIISLPPEKLTRLRVLIRKWRGRRACRKRELLSLIGQLQHACKVVRAGRTFLRRMIDLSMVAKKTHHSIRLNKAFQSDLLWWTHSWRIGMGCRCSLACTGPLRQRS